MFNRLQNNKKISSVKMKSITKTISVKDRDNFYDIPEELIIHIASYLNLRDLFSFTLTNTNFFQMMQKVKVEPPKGFLSFVLMTVRNFQSISRIDLQNISQQNENKSILIKSDEGIHIYGLLENQWKVTNLEKNNQLETLIDFPKLPYRKVNHLVNRKEAGIYRWNRQWCQMKEVSWFIHYKESILDRETLFLLEKDDYLTAYWNDGKIVCENSLKIDDAKDILESLSNITHFYPSNDQRLIKLIISKYACDPAFNIKVVDFSYQNHIDQISDNEDSNMSDNLNIAGISYNKNASINKIFSTLKSGHDCLINFSAILKANHERQLRIERINEISLIQRKYYRIDYWFGNDWKVNYHPTGNSNCFMLSKLPDICSSFCIALALLITTLLTESLISSPPSVTSMLYILALIVLSNFFETTEEFLRLTKYKIDKEERDNLIHENKIKPNPLLKL